MSRRLPLRRSFDAQRPSGPRGAEATPALDRATGGPADARFQPARHRGGEDPVVLFRRRDSEQPGDDHLHRLQRAGGHRDRGVADDDPPARRDVPERLAATRHERSGPGLEPGHDRRVRPRQRHAQRHARQPDPDATRLGAQAFATLDAGALSAATPAATLRAGNVSDPSLLASTPDANTTDPFIQEEAAKLAYDPQQIFNFLHTQVGYNSYLGSVRGAGARSGRARAMRSTSPAWAWP